MTLFLDDDRGHEAWGTAAWVFYAPTTTKNVGLLFLAQTAVASMYPNPYNMSTPDQSVICLFTPLPLL